jgi:AcrR family transcriptional regulator
VGRTAAQRSLRDLRRTQIVAAARALVAERGLEALTIGALEERLGFSRGVITYHFEDKDEIVEEVLRSAVEDIDADTASEVAAAHSFDDKLRAVLRTKLRGFAANREAGRILLTFWGRLWSDKRARSVNAQLFARYRAQSKSLIEAGQAAGAFAKDADADAFGALLVGTVIGLATQAAVEEGALDLEAALEEAARSFVARLHAPSPQRRA